MLTSTRAIRKLATFAQALLLVQFLFNSQYEAYELNLAPELNTLPLYLKDKTTFQLTANTERDEIIAAQNFDLEFSLVKEGQKESILLASTDYSNFKDVDRQLEDGDIVSITKNTITFIINSFDLDNYRLKISTINGYNVNNYLSPAIQIKTKPTLDCEKSIRMIKVEQVKVCTVTGMPMPEIHTFWDRENVAAKVRKSPNEHDNSVTEIYVYKDDQLSDTTGKSLHIVVHIDGHVLSKVVNFEITKPPSTPTLLVNGNTEPKQVIKACRKQLGLFIQCINDSDPDDVTTTIYGPNNFIRILTNDMQSDAVVYLNNDKDDENPKNLESSENSDSSDKSLSGYWYCTKQNLLGSANSKKIYIQEDEEDCNDSKLLVNHHHDFLHIIKKGHSEQSNKANLESDSEVHKEVSVDIELTCILDKQQKANLEKYYFLGPSEQYRYESSVDTITVTFTEKNRQSATGKWSCYGQDPSQYSHVHNKRSEGGLKPLETLIKISKLEDPRNLSNDVLNLPVIIGIAVWFVVLIIIYVATYIVLIKNINVVKLLKLKKLRKSLRATFKKEKTNSADSQKSPRAMDLIEYGAGNSNHSYTSNYIKNHSSDTPSVVYLEIPLEHRV